MPFNLVIVIEMGWIVATSKIHNRFMFRLIVIADRAFSGLAAAFPAPGCPVFGYARKPLKRFLISNTHFGGPNSSENYCYLCALIISL
jgi:hypothetical protein